MDEHAAAQEVFGRKADALRMDEAMEAQFVLWRITRDVGHLERAKALLDQRVASAPEEYRLCMIEDVPLSQEIVEAWQSRGEAS